MRTIEAGKGKGPVWIAHTQPGFETIAAREIRDRLEGATVRDTGTVADRNGTVRFTWSGDPDELFGLRTVEDLFVSVAEMADLPRTREGLRILEATAARARGVSTGLDLLRRASPARIRKGGPRFRVVARQVGAAAYRRNEAQRAVERGIAARGDGRWELAAEGGLEFWLTMRPGESWLALRLTDERMRHREGREEHLPASLRPSAAAALVLLTRPSPEDVFLDPMCGSGTILIERALAGRYRLLLGGDESPEAVQATLRNVGPRHKPIEIRRWDARRLPIDASSVSAIAVNLPFGGRVGTVEANLALYPDFMREAERVLRPGGRLVCLTGDAKAFDLARKASPALKFRGSHSVRVLGRPARIHVLERS